MRLIKLQSSQFVECNSMTNYSHNDLISRGDGTPAFHMPIILFNELLALEFLCFPFWTLHKQSLGVFASSIKDGLLKPDEPLCFADANLLKLSTHTRQAGIPAEPWSTLPFVSSESVSAVFVTLLCCLPFAIFGCVLHQVPLLPSEPSFNSFSLLSSFGFPFHYVPFSLTLCKLKTSYIFSFIGTLHCPPPYFWPLFLSFPDDFITTRCRKGSIPLDLFTAALSPLPTSFHTLPPFHIITSPCVPFTYYQPHRSFVFSHLSLFCCSPVFVDVTYRPPVQLFLPTFSFCFRATTCFDISFTHLLLIPFYTGLSSVLFSPLLSACFASGNTFTMTLLCSFSMSDSQSSLYSPALLNGHVRFLGNLKTSCSSGFFES